MEDVLDLYAEPYDPRRPVVRFGETSTQLLADAREPLSAMPGRPRREGHEYRRQGARNLFLACEPPAGRRHVAVTERRIIEDFARRMRWPVDEAYPDVPVIRLVLDNLNTHRKGSLYQTFPAGGGPSHRQEAGVLLHAQARHAQARRLAEHGGDRVQRLLPQLPRAASPRRGIPLPGGPGPGTGAKPGSSPHQLALRNPGCKSKAPSPLSHRFLT